LVEQGFINVGLRFVCFTDLVIHVVVQNQRKMWHLPPAKGILEPWGLGMGQALQNPRKNAPTRKGSFSRWCPGQSYDPIIYTQWL